MSAPDETRGCSCIARMNAALVPRQTQLFVGRRQLSGDTAIDCLMVATIRLDPSSREMPVAVIAAFCPFCGVKATS